MSKKIVITAAGNTVFGDEDIVASAIGKNVLFKPVKDLNIGELVCYDAQYIDKTLEDIEPDLYKDSRRYKTAKDSLHIDGQTALSYYLNNSSLLKGLNENERIDKLHEAIDKKVTKQTVKNWLSGKTVLPEPENLGLIAGIHPELKDFYEGFQKKQEGLAYPLYDLYNNVRRGLAHYLAKPKGLGAGEKKEVSTPLESITLAPEIDIVVRRYFNKINEKTDAVRVTGIKELERKEALKMSSSGNYEKLKKGVVRINPDKKKEFLEKNNMNEISVIDMYNDSLSFVYIIGKYAKRLFNERVAKEPEESLFTVLARNINVNRASASLISAYKNNISIRTKPLYQQGLFVENIDTEEIYKLGVLDIDKLLPILGSHLKEKITENEHNTIEKLISSMDNVANSFPSAFIKQYEYRHEYNEKALKSKINGHTTPEEKRKINELINKINHSVDYFKNNYGFDTSQTKTKENRITVTDEDGKAVLKKYGMEDLIPKIF